MLRRRLLQIHAATELASLRIPPGNQLEALKADRRGQHSIRVDDQWRTCFVWKSDGAHDVEIVNGLRPINADTALRPGISFGMEPRFWLNLQAEYDIRVANRELRAKLAPRIRVFQPATV